MIFLFLQNSKGDHLNKYLVELKGIQLQNTLTHLIKHPKVLAKSACNSLRKAVLWQARGCYCRCF